MKKFGALLSCRVYSSMNSYWILEKLDWKNPPEKLPKSRTKDNSKQNTMSALKNPKLLPGLITSTIGSLFEIERHARNLNRAGMMVGN